MTGTRGKTQATAGTTCRIAGGCVAIALTLLAAVPGTRLPAPEDALALAPKAETKQAKKRPRIRVRRGRLVAGRRPFRAYGFNWGVGDRYPILRYFDKPTGRRLRGLDRELRTARKLGANSLRIYLEIGHVMRSPTKVNRRALDGLRRLLEIAARERVYLDITGNLTWRLAKVPTWYDELADAERWRVQERFWRAVAEAAADSPAVLCYELTSEPVVGDDPSEGYYRGEFGGYRFIQAIAFANGRDPNWVAREWTARMAAAIRAHDDRPVTIGLLPFAAGPFGPGNVADLLDLVSVHEFPETGEAAESIELIRRFASHGRPLLLGETALLFGDEATQTEFLLGADPYLAAGTLSFFDGRRPRDVEPDASPADLVYRKTLSNYLALRSRLAR